MKDDFEDPNSEKISVQSSPHKRRHEKKRRRRRRYKNQEIRKYKKLMKIKRAEIEDGRKDVSLEFPEMTLSKEKIEAIISRKKRRRREKKKNKESKERVRDKKHKKKRKNRKKGKKRRKHSKERKGKARINRTPTPTPSSQYFPTFNNEVECKSSEIKRLQGCHFDSFVTF